MEAMGYPRYRARQVWHWIYRRRVVDWAAMRNLPAELRARLAAGFCLRPVDVRAESGTSGQTVKLLMGLADGDAVKIVLAAGLLPTAWALVRRVRDN